jgi:hypothetical protein
MDRLNLRKTLDGYSRENKTRQAQNKKQIKGSTEDPLPTF